MIKRFDRLSDGARPFALAGIKGEPGYKELRALAKFFPYRNGTLLTIEAWGLPFDTAPCAPNICALHIHDGDNCAKPGAHYNPNDCPHPAHAGDLPPLFSNHGYAYLSVYTERFTPQEVVGKTVVIHAQRDDFSTQPSGDAGARIACGVIFAG